MRLISLFLVITAVQAITYSRRRRQYALSTELHYQTFFKGYVTGLAKDTIGDSGYTAFTDAKDALAHAQIAANDYHSGNDANAWDNLSTAGFSALGSVTKRVEQIAQMLPNPS